ncbi:MAG: type II toxin-antitoxin system PemK/MazF family toxin [Candidatus Omnitrophica bacterium]|nr:type II toxin-antitoxin system PemK/MazF family toxin [Candidatus Omnitrophota bacterium]
MPQEVPRRGEVWLADLDPSRGHQQAGTRPVLVLSRNEFNSGPANLAIVIPITTKVRKIPTWVEVVPPEGGLLYLSAILCEGIRSIALDRLVRRLGQVGPQTLVQVEFTLRALLQF